MALHESTPARPIVSRSCSAAGQLAELTGSPVGWTGMRKDAPASRLVCKRSGGELDKNRTIDLTGYWGGLGTVSPTRAADPRGDRHATLPVSPLRWGGHFHR